MDPAWDRSRGPRPSTASIRVRELSWQGLRNPCPQSKGLGSHGGSRREQLVEHYLSPARLQALARVDDLQLVRVLEMCVDTREGSLGNFGVHLPNLNQLKLNGSRLGSLRDLGTSLGRLQVLWLARCGLNDLDGIGSFPALKELYVSYNNISDLSPLCLLEQLEVLDLEGNSVEDLGQVRYLQLCPRLATLTLEGNLVCLRPAPDPSNKIVSAEPPCRDSTPSCPCLRPSPGPPGPGPSPCWSLGAPCLKACFLRTQPRQTTPAISLMVLAKSSAGTPPKACGSVGTSARHLGSQQEGATAPWGPRRAPEEQDDQAEPKTPCSPQSLASEHSRTLSFHLTPSLPKCPMPPDSGSSSPWRSADLFRGRQLRALDSLGPGLGHGVAAVTALRALEVASGLSPGAQGCPGPKPAPDPRIQQQDPQASCAGGT
ncbi:leucine-rich repeat-containing protein 56 isoform X9 [Lemur catta]|uniref:leucine-rich repeat-containing protein 56 isoform X9 n=1 Tax=Lemur catta TaxID=9447 RepID=UPI001E26A56B|nr:leucine-rich repeat-containing protein 56 isoform X9 [Lemur catta]